ncbi:MAG TPA: HigA family addiction module antitoxin [Polyangia bacterium]
MMIPENRATTHPGEMLLEEFLWPMEIPQTKFAEKLGISVRRVNAIITRKRGITAETAWLFSDALGTSPQFWMNLQTMYDLTKARPEKHVKRIVAAG